MVKAKILIVEDEAITANDIQDGLKGFGYDVPAIASSGAEAIKKAEELKPDLVLMDIVLKGDMDGIEAAEHILNRFDIPVVYLTAYIDEARLEKIKGTEPFGYIIKPLEDKELRPAIEMALQRHTLEKKLQESEEFSSNLMSKSPNPIIVINPDTSVRYVNPALERLTGFSSAELIGCKAPYSWWTEATLQKAHSALAKAMSDGVHKLDVVFQKRTGERFWVEITSAPIRSGGELKYYIANWVDITERKQAEEKVKEAYRLRENFLMETSHRIITPATIIGGYVDLLLENSNLDERQREKILNIRERNEEVQRLVKDALLGKYLKDAEE